ncbi:hypothetical protein [Antarctobacter sp.]|uniref:hypothetical protein n=1 Tax=Antarctobacter sp. TaxID=1872577 RepID=UPI002B27B62B|nr:hypothetical protein [Antarctobacter sp.]
MATTLHDNPANDLDDLLSSIGECVGNDAASSADNGRLRKEAETMIAKAKAHADQSRGLMLDPLLPRAQIEDARRASEATALDCQRLEAAIGLLDA